MPGGLPALLLFLTDEDFDGRITAGLLHLEPTLPLVRVQDVGLSGANDPTLLARAAVEERLFLTHDRRTIPGFAIDRVLAGVAQFGAVGAKLLDGGMRPCCRSCCQRSRRLLTGGSGFMDGACGWTGDRSKPEPQGRLLDTAREPKPTGAPREGAGHRTANGPGAVSPVETTPDPFATPFATPVGYGEQHRR